MILASWLFDAAFVSPCLFFYGSSASQNHCDFFLADSWDGLAYAVAHLLFGFLVPALLIVSFYQRVVRYIWRMGADGRTVRRTMNIVPRTKVKTIKMFLMLNAVFLLTWTPFYIAQLWHPKETTGPSRRSALFFITVAWITFSSTASKPTLYSVYNANFRRGMRETFCMSSMKCYRSNAYTITASSRIAKKNYVGVVDLPVPAKTLIKDSVYDTFDREAKEKKGRRDVSERTDSESHGAFGARYRLLVKHGRAGGGLSLGSASASRRFVVVSNLAMRNSYL
ncbi:hypothetical protein cypCar_00044375 [Cyprinus carpio]|nr:hypothetical protein cypCar_00044375 [Cyprinus carpio]